MSLILVAVATLAATPAVPSPARVTLLFSGDNGGEVAPCGCRTGPAGGLPRRLTAVQRLRAQGPALLVDAGDALSVGLPKDGALDAAATQRAEQVMQAMGQMGYAALAVGEGELALGIAQLRKLAAAAKIPLLASNLRAANGKSAFEGGRVVDVAGVKVGLFAVVDGLELGRFGLRQTPALEAANRESAALRKQGARLVVALIHAPYTQSLSLAQAMKGVDYAIQAHDARASLTQRVGTLLLTGAGERGRQLGLALFELGDGSPLFDRNDAGLAKDQLIELDNMMARMPEEQRARLATQRTAVAMRIIARPADGQGSAATRFISLGADVPDYAAPPTQTEALTPGK